MQPHRPTAHGPHPSPHALDVLVIGAGQAGLAVGYHLPAAAAVPARRRRPRDRAHLAHPLGLAAAVHPGRVRRAARHGVPRRAPAPTRARTRSPTTSLAYAARFDLPVMLNMRGADACDQRGRRHVPGRHQPGHPAGPGRSSSPPARSSSPPSLRVADGFGAAVTQLHSSAYRNPDDLPDRRRRSWSSAPGTPACRSRSSSPRTHEVHLAVGTRPRPLPQRPLGRDLFWWLTRTGVVTRPAYSPLAAWFRKRGGDLVIGTTWDDIDAAGIRVRPRLTAADGHSASSPTAPRRRRRRGRVGHRLPARLLLARRARRRGTARQVVHHRGVTDVPGLWFIGLPWQHTRGSALLGFVGDDAAWVAASL